MSEDYKAVLVELEALEDFKDVTVDAWTKVLGSFRSLSEDYAELKAKAVPVQEPPDPKEEEFAERLAKAEERFAEQLKTEREARQKVEQAFAAEQRARRLEHFNDVAQGYDQLAGYEQFGADLMAVADLDAEVFGRLDAMLKAASKAVEQGQLFSQQANARPVRVDSTADPFEAEVERVRLEQFSDLPRAQGSVKAMDVVQEAKPELARAYAQKAGW